MGNMRKLSPATIISMFNTLATNRGEKKLIDVLLSVYSSFTKDNRFKYFDKYLSSLLAKERVC